MRTYVRAIIFATAFVFVLRLTLTQFNEFLDPLPPEIVRGRVMTIGVRHQPLSVSFMTLKVKNEEMRVDVLPSRAASTKIGDEVPLAIGSGLLRKRWSILEEDYRQYDNVPFKALYLGAFTLGILALSFVYVKGAAKVQSRAVRNFYLACWSAGIACFYLL